MRSSAFFDAGAVLHKFDDAAPLIGFVVEELVLLQVHRLAAVAAKTQLTRLGKLLVRVAPKMTGDGANQFAIAAAVLTGNVLLGGVCVHDSPLKPLRPVG